MNHPEFLKNGYQITSPMDGHDEDYYYAVGSLTAAAASLHAFFLNLASNSLQRALSSF